MSPTGARNSTARSRAPAPMSPRSPPAPARSVPRSPPGNRKHRSTSMSEKTTHYVGIIMNGVTGRMGLNQHLRRSIYAIMKQGGVQLGPSEFIMPQPILVGRNSAKLEAISADCGGIPWTTNLDRVLDSPDYSIYFDAQTTDRRAADVRKAIASGKHIYCEKPVSDS